MKRLAASLLLAFAAVKAHWWSPENDVEAYATENWSLFKEKYNKVYDASEEASRFEIFKMNVQLAKERNIEAGETQHGITQFSDLTAEEFSRGFKGYKPNPEARKDVKPFSPDDAGMKAGMTYCSSTTDCDYRTLGAVTAVKNQGQCGSCWAFSTTEQTESTQFMCGKGLPTLSEQQLVDCDTSDYGCGGGDTTTAFKYVIANGLESEASYPYTATRREKCEYTASKVVAHLSSWTYGVPACMDSCNGQNETLLWNQVMNIGPMSICVNAANWNTYTNGIYSVNCPHAYRDLDHCVQLTGYGTDKGVKYWWVRNSWGKTWGEAGYIRLSYGVNQCGVADEVITARC